MPKRHWRDWFGPYVDVIKPKVALLMSDCGLAKFAWFVALSASARNCKLTLSDKVNVRKMLKSVSKKPGPRRVFRPADPKRAPVSGAHAQFEVQFTPSTVLSNHGPAPSAPRCAVVPTPPRVLIVGLSCRGTCPLPPASKFGALPCIT